MEGKTNKNKNGEPGTGIHEREGIKRIVNDQNKTKKNQYAA